MHAAADSGCNENAHLMCERSNYGRVLVAAEVMESWRRSGDGLALGTYAPLAIERRPRSRLSVGRGNLGELSAGDLPQADLGTTSPEAALERNFRLVRYPSAIGNTPVNLRTMRRTPTAL